MRQEQDVLLRADGGGAREPQRVACVGIDALIEGIYHELAAKSLFDFIDGDSDGGGVEVIVRWKGLDRFQVYDKLAD